MSLLQQIDIDLKNAMRAKDATTLSVLRLLKSAIKYAALEKPEGGAELSEADAIQAVRKELKKREDAIVGYQKASRQDLVDKEKVERDILTKYLPKSLGPEEIAHLVRKAIAETGATSKAQMGAVMKIVSAKAQGRADGRTLSTEVHRQLSINA